MTGGLGIQCVYAEVVHSMTSRVGMTVLHNLPAGSWMCIGLSVLLVYSLLVSNCSYCGLLRLP